VGSPTTAAHVVERVPSSLPKDQKDSSPAHAHWARDIALALTVVVGAVLRFRQYAFNRSLWYDELFLAFNVRDRSLRGLTHPLIFSQAAPIGFLWPAKVSIEAFGQSELAYRLVPLIAGIATVACVALVGRRIFTAPAAIAAAGMIAIADQSIHYSSEFKQYSMEAAVAAALLLVASRCLGTRLSDEPRHHALLAIAGALALICSISAIFVLAGVALVLLVEVVRLRRYEHCVNAVWVALTWAATAAVMYRVSWAKDAGNANLHSYWKHFYGPAPWAHPQWYVSSWTAMIKTQVAISWSGVALGLTVVGSLWLARRAPTIAIIAVVTVVGTAAASWRGEYPFGGRLLLFLVPTVCLVFAAVVDAVMTFFARYHPAPAYLVACVCAVLLVGGSIDTAWTRAEHPYESEEMRQVLEAMRPQFKSGDHLFVADGAALSFDFYRDRTGFADVPFAVQEPDPTRGRIPAFLTQVHRLGPGPTWLLYSRLHPGTDPFGAGNTFLKEALYFSAHVKGKVARVIRRPGVLAVEFDQRG
jgi:hypothetical protein